MKTEYFIISLLTILNIGCKTEEEAPPPIADFEYTIISGGKVQFQNKSENADVFAWEFGDEDNSASYEENPKFTYLKAGTYDVFVKLYAGNGYTGVNNTITKKVSLIDVPPSIIIDGIFDDWKDVSYVSNVVASGTLEKIKLDGSNENSINIYLEGTDINFSIPRLFINSDNNSGTGYVNNNWYSKSGFEILIEGGDYYKHKGESGMASWDWEWQGNSNAIRKISNLVKLSTGKTAVELSLNKNAIKNLTGLSEDGITFVIDDLNSSWTRVGKMPAEGQDAIFVKF